MDIATSVFLTIGAIVVLFVVISVVEAVNKKSKLIEKNAQKLVQHRIAIRSSSSVQSIVEKCGIPINIHQKAKYLLECLGTVIIAEPEKLKCDDRFDQLLRVSKYEFDNLDEKAWKRSGYDGYIEIFGHDIFELLETSCDAVKWNRAWDSMQKAPTSEDEWIDFIFSLNLCQFLQFFSLLIKR